MLKTFIHHNKILASIIIFLAMFGLIQILKPSFLFNRDGSLRQFGIGYRNKTILPMWLLAIILGILSYISVRYYLIL
jgi:hypothetical protein